MVIVLIVLAALIAGAAGYVWGWANGSSKPVDDCRHKDRAVAAEHAAYVYRQRVQQLEDVNGDLTWTGEYLIATLDRGALGRADLDKVKAAAYGRAG